MAGLELLGGLIIWALKTPAIGLSQSFEWNQLLFKITQSFKSSMKLILNSFVYICCSRYIMQKSIKFSTKNYYYK